MTRMSYEETMAWGARQYLDVLDALSRRTTSSEAVLSRTKRTARVDATLFVGGPIYGGLRATVSADICSSDSRVSRCWCHRLITQTRVSTTASMCATCGWPSDEARWTRSARF